jgi:hypothetical protein
LKDLTETLIKNGDLSNKTTEHPHVQWEKKDKKHLSVGTLHQKDCPKKS